MENKTVRAKFTVREKTDTTVKLTPVYGGNPENDSFFKYTPSGDITMSVVNETALARFEVGKDYYVDFTPAD